MPGWPLPGGRPPRRSILLSGRPPRLGGAVSRVVSWSLFMMWRGSAHPPRLPRGWTSSPLWCRATWPRSSSVHVAALVAADGAVLDGIAASFAALGANLLAAEAAAAAAGSHRQAGRGASAAASAAAGCRAGRDVRRRSDSGPDCARRARQPHPARAGDCQDGGERAVQPGDRGPARGGRCVRSTMRLARYTRNCASAGGPSWPLSSRCPDVRSRQGVVLWSAPAHAVSPAG